jgi:hypothetical protein
VSCSASERGEAEVFAVSESRVLRLARTAELRDAAERERVALVVAGRCGAPAPAAFERVDVDRVLPVLAAARLSYDIDQERMRLLAIARRGLKTGAP